MRVKGWIPLLLFISAAAVVQAGHFSDEDQIPDEVARGDSDESGEDEKAFQGAVEVRNCALPLDEPSEADAEVALIEEKGLGKWTDHPVRESDLTIDRDCDCSVKWIKKVYPIKEDPYRKPLSPSVKVYPIKNVPYRKAHHQFSPSSTFKLKYKRDEPTGYDGHHVELHHLSGFGFPPPNCKPCNVLKKHRRRRYHHITHIQVDKIHHTEIVHHRIDIHHVRHISTVHKCIKEEKKCSKEEKKKEESKEEKKKSVAEEETQKKKETKEEKKHSSPEKEHKKMSHISDHEKKRHHHEKRHHHHHHKKHHHKKKSHHKHHHKKHHEKKKKKHQHHHHHHHHSHHKQHQKHHYSRLASNSSN